MDDMPQIDWAISSTPVDYETALSLMEARVTAIQAGDAAELIWLLEHPPLYTAGTSALPQDLKQAGRFPVYQTGRGGQFTYHGPGQRVIYCMLDLKRRDRDVRKFVGDLERWIISTLETFNIQAGPRDGRIGVWVDRTHPGGPLREAKIAAIGVRIKRWVSLHGISLNVEPDLEHFTGITPCGIEDPRFGVTSLVDLGYPVDMADADTALRTSFETVFQRRTRTVPLLTP